MTKTGNFRELICPWCYPRGERGPLSKSPSTQAILPPPLLGVSHARSEIVNNAVRINLNCALIMIQYNLNQHNVKFCPRLNPLWLQDSDQHHPQMIHCRPRPLSERYDPYLPWSCEQVDVNFKREKADYNGASERLKPLWSSSRAGPHIGRPALVHVRELNKLAKLGRCDSQKHFPSNHLLTLSGRVGVRGYYRI